jgi:hypothetical protein
MEYAVEWQAAGMLDVTPHNCLIREILEKLLSGAADGLNLFHSYEATKKFTF